MERSVRKVSKGIGITRKFFGNVRMIPATVRLNERDTVDTIQNRNTLDKS